MTRSRRFLVRPKSAAKTSAIDVVTDPVTARISLHRTDGTDVTLLGVSSDGKARVRVDDDTQTWQVYRRGDTELVLVEPGGDAHVVSVQPADALRLAATKPLEAAEISPQIEAPITGILLELRVAAGDTVHIGMPLLVIEAMKMELVIGSPLAGSVEAIYVAPGDKVRTGDALLLLEPADVVPIGARRPRTDGDT